MVPSSYLISLPVATLIAGAEMLALHSLLVFDVLLSPDESFWRSVLGQLPLNILLFALIGYLFLSEISLTHVLLMTIVPFIGFWVATFGSGYLLWQTVWGEDRHWSSSRISRQRLRGLLLLIAFAWAFLYLVTYVGTLLITGRPSIVG